MSATTITRFIQAGEHRLNVTLRNDYADVPPETLQGVVSDTIKGWLYVASLIQAGDYTHEIKTTAPTIEDKYNLTDAARSEAIVTVWDAENGGRKLGLTLHSNSVLQVALRNYGAFEAAVSAIAAPAPETTPEVAPTHTHTPAAAPVHTNGNGNGGSAKSANGLPVFSNAKSATETCAPGQQCVLTVSKIRLCQQDATVYYGLHGRYGANVSQHPDVRVYTDNDIARNNGVLASLEALGLAVGGALEANWQLIGQVYLDKKQRKTITPLKLERAS